VADFIVFLPFLTAVCIYDLLSFWMDLALLILIVLDDWRPVFTLLDFWIIRLLFVTDVLFEEVTSSFLYAVLIVLLYFSKFTVLVLIL